MVSMLDYWRVTLWSILAFFPLLRPLEVGKAKMAGNSLPFLLYSTAAF